MTLGRQNTDAQQSNQGQGAGTRHQLVGIAGASNKVAGIHLADRPTGEPSTFSAAPRSLLSIDREVEQLTDLVRDAENRREDQVRLAFRYLGSFLGLAEFAEKDARPQDAERLVKRLIEIWHEYEKDSAKGYL